MTANRMRALLGLLQARVTCHDSRCARTLAGALGDLPVARPRLPGAAVAGCTLLEPAMTGLDMPLGQALADVEDDLAWRVPGFGRLPPDLSGKMAVSVLVGPDGMIEHPKVSLGLLLMGPGVIYPAHCHAAEELYLVLSGALDWTIDDQNIGQICAGAFVHHAPWQRHAMTTGAAPALLVWGWTGDICGSSYAMSLGT